MRVHQLLSGAGPVDGVTAQARAYRARFRAWGWEGEDRAAWPAPGTEGIGDLGGFAPRDGDVLLFHYSAYAPKLRPLLARPNPKLVVFHNVTPAEWMWEADPRAAVQCAVGRRQLGDFAAAADLALGVSEYNARELAAAGAAQVDVLPVLFEPGRFAPSTPRAGEPAPEVLFVGRRAPHKRHDELIRALALLRRLHLPAARLTLVGEPVNADFDARLRALADALAPGAVSFEQGLSEADLAGRYARAGAFLCLSEHEGFCIPLLEAFAAGLPVVARRAGGAGETAGNAAVLLEKEDDAGVAAAALAAVLSDASLREELRARGRARLARYAPHETEAKLRAAVERVGRRA